jgi:hypothetical protein
VEKDFQAKTKLGDTEHVDDEVQLAAAAHEAQHVANHRPSENSLRHVPEKIQREGIQRRSDPVGHDSHHTSPSRLSAL